MSNDKQEVKRLEDKIDGIWKLYARLDEKGGNYQYAAHAISEIANYLIGETATLKIAEHALTATVEHKTLTQVIEDEAGAQSDDDYS